ncbi:MAG: hypothetical protein ACLFUP_06495 [Desulfobacteraceae bacterium]
MDSREAITSFSQGEKIKAGLIWASQALELIQGLGGMERAGGHHVTRGLLGMIGHEVQLVRSVTGDEAWDELFPLLERAVVMIDSGVPQESLRHLSTALSKTTSVLQRSMTFLRDENLL